MAKRGYNQYCAAARALDLLGERWTLLLIRELLTGPKRYTDLLHGMPGIGTNLLADRLKDLETAGVIQRSELPPPAASAVYELTERGRELESVIVPLARWGLPLLGRRDREQAWQPEWSILAMRATFRPERADGIDEQYQFEIDGEVFFAHVKDGEVSTGRGPATDPVFTLRASVDSFLAVADGSLSAAEAAATGGYSIDGDSAAFERCVEIFSLPPCAEVVS
jgi:DNA-binding HxlR family transcriptional regulator/putative sterol carrier protein